MRSLLVLLFLFAAAGAAEAQYVRAYAQRQTAMGGLGQVGVLKGSGDRPTKPFASISQTPTLSPYLNLFRDEDEESDGALPAYFAFVRPQQEQQEANRRQQVQLQALQRQLQQTSTVTAPPQRTNVAGGARYGDTGRYYSGWRR